MVEIIEAKALESKAVREKGDPSKPGSVSAPMSGEIIKIDVQAGEYQVANSAWFRIYRSPTTSVQAVVYSCGVDVSPEADSSEGNFMLLNHIEVLLLH